MARWQDNKLSDPFSDAAGKPRIQLTPYFPSDDLKFFVERYWAIGWDLQDLPPYHLEHVPEPSVHLLIEKELSWIVGVMRSKFSRLAEGRGYAFSIKFKPGAFYPFVLSPVSRFTDKRIDPYEIFAEDGAALEMAIRGTEDGEERVEIAENFLRSRHPEPDDLVALIHRIVERIVADREITRTHHLENQFNLTTRTLQRLFSRYVGVSPSWVIRRYRLHNAVEKLDQGGIVDWAALAADLGYFDQAHFIKDFKRIIGVTPGDYVPCVSPDWNSHPPPN